MHCSVHNFALSINAHFRLIDNFCKYFLMNELDYDK